MIVTASLHATETEDHNASLCVLGDLKDAHGWKLPLRADCAPQNVTHALQAAQEDLRVKGEALGNAETKNRIQEKALEENMSAMRAERDGLAELTAKLEKQRERPAGVDASGKQAPIAMEPMVSIEKQLIFPYRNKW